MTDTTAKHRMTHHRAIMRGRGFKSITTFLPPEANTFIEQERKRRRLAGKGDAIAALIAEVQQYRQEAEEGLAKG